MNIELLSSKYQIKRIEEADIPEVYELCKGNPMYYRYCPPALTIDSVREDLKVFPAGKSLRDKYYIGFYDNGPLIAVMDLISGYPDKTTAFIGFFMMSKTIQKKGIGTAIITEACAYLKQAGFSTVKLGFVKGNPQSEAFWLKNQFIKTGVEKQAEGYTVVVMQRQL